jgi:hypothetical protein
MHLGSAHHENTASDRTAMAGHGILDAATRLIGDSIGQLILSDPSGSHPGLLEVGILVVLFAWFLTACCT